jgi:N-acetylglucosamine malate deacetylase 1
VGQIDGSSEINNVRYEEFDRLMRAQQPDVVFTHWPVDTHRDHGAASLLTYQSWYRASRKYTLIYFEVMSGEQTQQFAPNLRRCIGNVGKEKTSLFYACQPRTI